MRHDFHTRDEIVKETDCSRVFYVPGVTPEEKMCKGDIVDLSAFGDRSIICEADDCPLILGKIALLREQYGGF